VSFFIPHHPLLLAAASGVLSAVSIVFPALFFLVWVAFVPLFLSLRRRSAGQRLLLGLTTGLMYFGGAYHWVWWSMTQFFAFSPFVALVLFLGFLVWNGFVFALFAVALRQPSSAAMHLVFAALLWVVLEHYYPTLVPWQFGAILQPHLAALQLAEVTGGAGLSFLILLVNGLLFRAYEQCRASAAWGFSIVAAIGVVIALDAYGRWRFAQLETETTTRTLSIAIVQGNAPPMREVNEESFGRSLQTYSRLSLTASASHPDLIVWPEMAVRAILRTDDVARDALFSLTEQGGAPLLVGALDDRQSGETLNSAFLVSPAGEFFGLYHKTRLLPFAEFLPWPVHIFAQWWSVPSLVAGDQMPPLLLPNTRFAVAICSEALWPGFFRQALNEGAEFLVLLTNDVWLGNTNGPWQHLQAAVLRAVESRRWLVRAANSGVSAVIAPSGRIVARTELFTSATLHERITLRQDATFYTRWGDWFVFVCLAGVCLVGVARLWLGTALKNSA
jgi:apolipoprotein N-acyltransferase